MAAVEPDLAAGKVTRGPASILIRPVVHHDRTGFWLTNFVVQEDYRQQGIGTLFLKMIVDEVDRQHTNLWVDVIPAQTYMVKMYHSFGFIPEHDPFPSPADYLGTVQLWRPPEGSVVS